MPTSISELKEEVNGLMSDTTLHVKELFEQEREERQRALEQGVALERDARVRGFGELRQALRQELVHELREGQGDLGRWRHELAQELRSQLLPELKQAVAADVEKVQQDLLSVTMNLAAAKPQWQRDMEKLREEVLAMSGAGSVFKPQETPRTVKDQMIADAAAQLQELRAVEANFERQKEVLEKMQQVQLVHSLELNLQQRFPKSPQGQLGLQSRQPRGDLSGASSPTAGHTVVANVCLLPPQDGTVGRGVASSCASDLEIGPPDPARVGATGDIRAGSGSAPSPKAPPLGTHPSSAPDDQATQMSYLTELARSLDVPLSRRPVEDKTVEETSGMVNADCRMSDRMSSFIRRCTSSQDGSAQIAR